MPSRAHDIGSPRSRRRARRRRSVAAWRPCRTTSSRVAITRTATAVLVGQLAGDARRPRTPALPPNAPPLASALAGSPPGSAPRGVGLEVRRLDPGRAQRAHPVAGRDLERPRQRHRRSPALHLAAQTPGPRPGSRRPPTRRRRRRRATSASGGAWSSAKPPLPSATSRTDRLRALRPRAGRGRRSPTDRPVRRLPTLTSTPTPVTDSTTVCHPVQRQRWASIACRTASGRRRCSSEQRRRAHHDARRAEPALAAAVVGEGLPPSSAASASPSIVVTERPATRPTCVTHATRGWPSIHTVQHPH